MDLSDLKGKTVVSTAEATKVGVVRDVVIAPDYQRIEALVLKVDEGGADQAVKADNIRSYGPDVATIDTTGSLLSFDQQPDLFHLPRGSALQKSRIVTESGKDLGEISDIEFDQTSGRILSFDYDGGAFAGLLGQRHKIDPKNVIKFGPGMVTVKDETQPKTRTV